MYNNLSSSQAVCPSACCPFDVKSPDPHTCKILKKDWEMIHRPHQSGDHFYRNKQKQNAHFFVIYRIDRLDNTVSALSNPEEDRLRGWCHRCFSPPIRIPSFSARSWVQLAETSRTESWNKVGMVLYEPEMTLLFVVLMCARTPSFGFICFIFMLVLYLTLLHVLWTLYFCFSLLCSTLLSW